MCLDIFEKGEIITYRENDLELLMDIRNGSFQKEDGSFILAYLGDGKTGFELELTWLRDWEKDHYDLGDNEIHLAFTTDDMEASHRKHEEMGCICFENPAMGIYFINDPDGYWLEIVPEKLG